MNQPTHDRALRFAISIAVVLGAIGLWSIRSTRLAPAAPVVRPDTLLIAAPPLSTFDAPVRIDFTRLVDLVEDHVPVQWVEDSIPGSADGPTASVAVTRGPFSASYGDGFVSLSATLAYAVRTTYGVPLLPDLSLSCGDDGGPAPRMDVRIRSPLALTPDWRLEARTEVVRLAPTSDRDRDRCEVSMFGFDITGRVQAGMRSYLSARTPMLDSLIASVDLRPRFERWWAVLGNPVALGSNLWLDLRPERVSYGGLSADATSLTVSARLTARPRIVLGPRPPSQPTPLPDLSRGAVEEAPFRSVVDGIADYAEISSSLTDLFGGSTLERVGQTVTIDGVSVWGLGSNQLGLEVTVSGDVSGTLYFVGSPVFHAEDATVGLPDLSMTVETSDVVVEAASWLLDSGLESMLRERARWPVDDALAWATDALQRGLNAQLGEGLYLRGELLGLSVNDVAARTGGLLVRAQVSGEVALVIEAR